MNTSKQIFQNIFFWISIFLLGLLLFIWFNYAIPQIKINKNYKTYVKQGKEKQSKRKAANDKIPRMVLLDQEIGDIYIKAYKDSLSAKDENFLGVEIKKETLDYFSRYLSGDSSIGVKFAIYNYAKLTASGYDDPFFNERLNTDKNPDKRIGLMFGVMKTGEPSTFKPFTIDKMTPFYDDWNNEWPPHN